MREKKISWKSIAFFPSPFAVVIFPVIRDPWRDWLTDWLTIVWLSSLSYHDVLFFFTPSLQISRTLGLLDSSSLHFFPPFLVLVSPHVDSLCFLTSSLFLHYDPLQKWIFRDCTSLARKYVVVIFTSWIRMLFLIRSFHCMVHLTTYCWTILTRQWLYLANLLPLSWHRTHNEIYSIKEKVHHVSHEGRHSSTQYRLRGRTGQLWDRNLTQPTYIQTRKRQ
jgi:hypothetical protein